MKYKNKEIYIVCSKQDRDIGGRLKELLKDEGIISKVSCEYTLEQSNNAVVNSDAAIIILTNNFIKDTSLNLIVNKITGKPTLSYYAEDVKLSRSLKYFLSKTVSIAEKDKPEEIKKAVKDLLERAKYSKDTLVFSDSNGKAYAEKTVNMLAEEGISSKTHLFGIDYKQELKSSNTIIVITSDKNDVKANGLIDDLKKNNKKLFISSISQEDFEKQVNNLILKIKKRIIKMKAPSNVILTDNIKNIKPIKRPLTKSIISIIFVQLLIVLVWIASKINILFLIVTLVAIVAFMILLLKDRKKCAYLKCKNSHNHEKVKVVVEDKSKNYMFKFCNVHINQKDVEGESRLNTYYPIALLFATIFFVVFLIGADVKISDFTFLDIRQNVEQLEPVEFSDVGFEAYIRKYLRYGQAPISRESLLVVQKLVFNQDDVLQQIISLDDLEHFPNLKIFDGANARNIVGDFESFTYTPELKILNIGLNSIGGDIAYLSGLSELNELIIDEGRDEKSTPIFGDIASLSGCNLNVILLRNTDVSGDISALKNMFRVDLSYTRVSGDIVSFKDIKDIGVALFAQTDVTGDISVFEDKNLISINFSHTDVYGDISIFKDMHGMHGIGFSYCEGIRGDISTLKNLNNISNIELDFTSVECDIEEITVFENLQIFKMSDTNTYGDISIFNDTLHITQLYLNGCDGIYGDIGAFNDKQDLRQLVLSNTEVSGYAGILANNPIIIELDLSGTNVYFEEESQEGDEPTLQSLGFDEQGALNDTAFGVSIVIESDFIKEVEEEVFNCTIRVREKKFDIKILFPDQTHEITFDGKTYRYIPSEFEVVGTDYDVDAALIEYLGGDITGIHDEIVGSIKNYCIGRFGFDVEALMEMNYD